MTSTSLAEMSVGDNLVHVSLPAIARETLVAYADVSGDHNPIHLDPAAARAVGLEDVIGQGMLTMAYLGRVVAEVIPQSSLQSFHARFHAPTNIGDRLTCTVDVAKFEDDCLHLALNVSFADGSPCVTGEAVARA